MPRLPVDGSKVIEHRITFGSKERMLLEDIVTSYRIDAISGNDSIVEVLADGGKVISMLGTIGAMLELLGITDVFDFDDELKAKVMEAQDRIKDKVKEKGWEGDRTLTSILFPWFGPYRAADFVREQI